MSKLLATIDEALRQAEQQAYDRGFADGSAAESKNQKTAALRTAASRLLSYRDTAGALNFQLEKADDFLNQMRHALAAEGE